MEIGNYATVHTDEIKLYTSYLCEKEATYKKWSVHMQVDSPHIGSLGSLSGSSLPPLLL